MWKKSAPVALAALSLSLAGCSEVSETAEQVGNATSKASVCSEALGLVNLNPNVDPAQVRAEAEEKAKRLRELGNQVAAQDVQQTLFTMADGYVELEQRKLDHVNGFNDWLQRNLKNLEQLRQVCL